MPEVARPAPYGKSGARKGESAGLLVFVATRAYATWTSRQQALDAE